MKERAQISSGRPRNFQFRLVYALLEYLTLIGVPESELKALTTQALARLSKRTKSLNRSTTPKPSEATTIATAIQRWYQDQALVDTNGNPIPLPLLGSAPSVEWLIRRERLRKNSERLANELVTLKVVRRCRNGKYLPVGRHLIVRNSHPFLAKHHASSMIRLLSTARSNVAAKSPGDRLFERCADIQYLPRSKTRAFREFTNQQCEAFIDTINDWLESNNVRGTRPTKARITEAGVHVFAFVGHEG
jgi:hypothetical protein